MAGTHLTGPLVVEGAVTSGGAAAITGNSTVTGTLKVSGKVSSAGSFNIVPFAAVGSTASTITVTGVAAGDIIIGAHRLRGWAGVPVVSNLTSIAVASANTITFTASPGVASGLVFGAYVDVSAAT